MTRPGIEPRSPGPLANTLTAGPIMPARNLEDQKKRTCYFADFVPRVNKYRYLERELKNVKVKKKKKKKRKKGNATKNPTLPPKQQKNKHRT